MVQPQLALVFEVDAGWEHQVAQAVEVFEDALNVCLGEVEVLLRIKRPWGVELSCPGTAERGRG
ncbi:hypothetical protein D3C77_326940 [compost metagenome]